MTSQLTTDDVLRGMDLSGRTAVVTGASSGLGVETARALTAAGCHVLVAVRDVAKARRVVSAENDVVAVDLADLDSVRAAAPSIAEKLPRIDILVNNAGVMASPLLRTAQGFEMQLGTNHLGHFVFTSWLTPNLAEGARIVNLSSDGHQISGMLWDDPNFTDESRYDKWLAYGQSKSANVLFTLGLHSRLADRGVQAFAVHPGVIPTELSRHLGPSDFSGLGNLELTDVAHGAATSVWAATAPDLAEHGGAYLSDCAVGLAAPHATDPGDVERLWEWSQRQIAPWSRADATSRLG
ncbi:SDR family NAD(P)-dependent oxidoreductase [Mycolicibacterium confluentis]|uniref:Oxidoreductase n=1 Tax=Mycolicibacterium confluentis TaxID=28047 RepID=A0A7I7Y2W9_9MYCO|nr:SDR family NAD(P)-dependent oxidoreductase [Mycolicibacterium confluentis]BBZ36040.1 oxidoreductase [Mycolicibacterium confluentis]